VAEEVVYAAIFDRERSETTLVGGHHKGGIEGWPTRAIAFSPDGGWLAFSSVFTSPTDPIAGDDSAWGQQVFVSCRSSVAFTLVSRAPQGIPGNSVSAAPSLSHHGRWVAFQSLADNLVAGDSNGKMDIMVLDRETGSLELVSLAGTS
jgi:hypothetical protein